MTIYRVLFCICSIDVKKRLLLSSQLNLASRTVLCSTIILSYLCYTDDFDFSLEIKTFSSTNYAVSWEISCTLKDSDLHHRETNFFYNI